MKINSVTEINAYKEAGKISTEILFGMYQAVKPGVLPIELDNIARKLCQKYNVKPSFEDVDLGFGRYGYATCVSVNDTILHGIPSTKEPLNEGDLVKLDMGIVYKSLFTDQCVTVGVGRLSKKNKKLIQTAKDSVLSAVSLARVGAKTGDLGNVMESISKKAGYKVLKNYVGHGIGYSLHEDPQIPAFGRPNTGEMLEKGMVICIESQLVAGTDETITMADHWSIKTQDGKRSAMFEYMVMVDETKPLILTPTQDWKLIV
jgi:methionyl aminopeptidase